MTYLCVGMVDIPHSWVTHNHLRKVDRVWLSTPGVGSDGGVRCRKTSNGNLTCLHVSQSAKPHLQIINTHVNRDTSCNSSHSFSSGRWLGRLAFLTEGVTVLSILGIALHNESISTLVAGTKRLKLYVCISFQLQPGKYLGKEYLCTSYRTQGCFFQIWMLQCSSRGNG